MTPTRPATAPVAAPRLPAGPKVGAVAVVETRSTPTSRRSRWRPVLGLLAGLAALDLGVYATADTWKRYSPDDYAERLAGCRSRPQDFVLVGGSPVSEGLDPGLIAGIDRRGTTLAHGYALGLPGGTVSDCYFAVKNGCPTPPKVLAYGATASDWNDSRHEPHGPYSLMTPGDVADWVATRPEAGEWVVRHYANGVCGKAWGVFRYRHGLRMWAADQAASLAPGACPEAAKEAAGNRAYSDALRAGDGYAPAAWFVSRRYDQMKQSGWVAPPFDYLARYRTGSHLKYLHRMAEWCEERGTELVIVDMPVTADLEARYPAEFAEFRQRLTEVETARGLTVLRATREAVGVDDSHFADLIHLNGEGAKRLSVWVRDRLAERGTTP